MIGVIEKAFTATEVVCNFRFIELFNECDAIRNELREVVDANSMGVVYCTCASFRMVKNRRFEATEGISVL